MLSIHWSGSTTHPVLLHTDQVEGGYTVSTSDGSAAVHMNNELEKITMDQVGSYTLEGSLPSGEEGDREVSLANGYGDVPSRWVELKDDGSLEVNAMGIDGADISTTLRPSKDGIDINVSGDGLKLRGDIVPNTPKA